MVSHELNHDSNFEVEIKGKEISAEPEQFLLLFFDTEIMIIITLYTL